MCRVWRLLITEVPDLQYKFELSLSGLDEALFPNSVALLDRPPFLRKYQQAWINLECTIYISLPRVDFYEWSNDIIFHHGILAYLNGSSSVVHLTQLPSPLLGIEHGDWDVHLPIMSPSLVGFQIDPFQDLLIAVCMNTWSVADTNTIFQSMIHRDLC